MAYCQLNICFSLACEQPIINIQLLLLLQIIPEINYNHIEVSMVMRIYHGNEVIVCGPVTIREGLNRAFTVYLSLSDYITPLKLMKNPRILSLGKNLGILIKINILR